MPRKRPSDIPPGTSYGHYIQEWRKFRGMKQKEVAAIIGEEPSSLSQLETGKQGYSQWKLETLARIYQTTPGALLDVNPLADGREDEDLRRVWVDLRDDEKRQAIEHLRVIRSTRHED